MIENIRDRFQVICSLSNLTFNILYLPSVGTVDGIDVGGVGAPLVVISDSDRRNVIKTIQFCK